MKSDLKILFRADVITIQRIKEALRVEDIRSIEKNELASGLAAGFGTSDTRVELYVFSEDFDRAMKILQDLL